MYSESAKPYGAYFVVTSYTGNAAGHFGDSTQYVNDEGELQNIAGATSSWGCSHNTGIAFANADAAPFASICSEDHGAIWLNTKTQSMNVVKISNENVTNGASNEPMGGMSGSYSSLARFSGTENYIFTWVSRGAVDLKQDTWMGGSNTQATARTVNRNVAIAYMSDKYTLVGPQAISQVGSGLGRHFEFPCCRPRCNQCGYFVGGDRSTNMPVRRYGLQAHTLALPSSSSPTGRRLVSLSSRTTSM